jgi:dUTP pyrophosphatase
MAADKNVKLKDDYFTTEDDVPFDWSKFQAPLTYMKPTLACNIKLVHPEARVPTYATDGAGCFDIYSAEEGILKAGSSGVFDTGVQFEIPEDYVMLIFSRSGMGFNFNIRLANCTGIIDSDFRSTVKIKLRSDGEIPLYIDVGDRIAQAIILPYQNVCFNVVDELSETERGQKGFGSSGK